jgi:sugar phosphate isomerase/epimerase
VSSAGFAMARRDVLGTIALFGSGAMLGGCMTGSEKSGLATGGRKLDQIGIQLWTVRSLFKENPAAMMNMLAATGFTQIEFANLEPLPVSPRELRKMADDLGIIFPSSHFNPPVFFDTPQKVIDIAGELGCNYVINSWIDEKERTNAGYRGQAERFNKVGADMRKAGFRYGFHNHQFEFAKMDGDKTGYDILVQNTDPALVDMELDMYWVVDGGADILDLLNRYRGRFKLAHIKDRTADGKMVDVGEGAIDWKAMIAKATDVGIEYFFVEHDEPAAPIAASVATSYNYLRDLRF